MHHLPSAICYSMSRLRRDKTNHDSNWCYIADHAPSNLTQTLEIDHRSYTHCFPTTLLRRLHLTDDNLPIVRKVIRRNLQVKRRRSLSYAARDIVVGAVAGTEPAAEVAGFANGHAAEMCAYAWYFVSPAMPLLQATLCGIWYRRQIGYWGIGMLAWRNWGITHPT